MPNIVTISNDGPSTHGAPYDPDADLKLSPLWPLQSALRQGFYAATNASGVTADQISRTWPVRTQIEDMFGQWRNVASLTTLRTAIDNTIVSLDLANDPVLSGFQAQLLALSQWNDSLPS